MKFDREADEFMHIDMTPLVDAIFAIVLFLVICSSIVESIEQDISIELPSYGSRLRAKMLPARPITVNVRNLPGGRPLYHIENRPMSTSALAMHLSAAKARNRDQSVVIRGDRNVKWEHVAAVMTAAAKAGISKVSATVEIRER